MSFAGTYILESRDNYDAFAAASGATPEQIERGTKLEKVKTEITNNGDTYTVTRHFPNQKVTNTFTLGVPTEASFAEGKKAKVVVTMEGGKLVMKGDNFSQVTELVGGKLKDTLNFKGTEMIRHSIKA